MDESLVLSEELVDPGARKLGLRDEPASPGAGYERAEVGRVAARDEHDVGPVAVGQLGGDVEAVDVGELHVEEHEIGAQAAGLLDARRAVSSLADDVEPLGLEQHARARTKGGVVVDDEDGQRHREAIVNAGNKVSYTAGYTPTASAISRKAAAGSAAPNTADPATKRVAPACAHGPAVVVSTPPSTSRAGPAPISARRRSTLPRVAGMNGWPPQPGLTVMHSARSRSAAISASTRTGVAGHRATPAVQPASLIAPMM